MRTRSLAILAAWAASGATAAGAATDSRAPRPSAVISPLASPEKNRRSISTCSPGRGHQRQKSDRTVIGFGVERGRSFDSPRPTCSRLQRLAEQVHVGGAAVQLDHSGQQGQLGKSGGAQTGELGLITRDDLRFNALDFFRPTTFEKVGEERGHLRRVVVVGGEIDRGHMTTGRTGGGR